MILVAGLAIAGLAGIAAAFYFSVRPGRSRGATGADRFARGRGRNPRPSSSAAAARSSAPARSAGSVNRRAAGHARPGSAAGYSAAAGLREDPGSLVADRRAARASTGPMRRASTGPMPAARPLPEARAGRRADAERFADAGRRAAATRQAEKDAQAAGEPSRSRRRVGWRKGADLDEEMWPVEAFGGVSDEQFWDDLATDKPLATTARTADPGPRSADSRPRRQPAKAYQLPGPGAADQTMVQPTAPSAVPPVPVYAAPPPVATQPYPTVTQPSPPAAQPVRAARQPAEPRGRRSAEAGGLGADEDPLTSPAYSLRAKGAVDGHSYLPSHRSREPNRSDGYQADPLRPDGYRTGSTGSSGTNGTPLYQSVQGSGGGYGGTAGYPYAEAPYSQPNPSTPSANTPPYGDSYGYRNPAGPATDPRQANGSRGHGRPGANGNGNGNGDRTWGSRQAYPPVNGYRSPNDSRGTHRRLTTARRSRAH